MVPSKHPRALKTPSAIFTTLFYLPAKVTVTRGIITFILRLYTLPIFYTENGDASFPFQVSIYPYQFTRFLVIPEDIGTVGRILSYQCCFT